MKRMILAAFLATTLLAPVAQADHVDRLVDHAHVSFVGEPDPVMVHDAIVAAGKAHGWVASNEQPGKLRLSNIIRGTFQVVVDVSYDAAGMTVDYVSSENLYYRTKGEVAYIHPKYNKWVNLLLTETKAKLNS